MNTTANPATEPHPFSWASTLAMGIWAIGIAWLIPTTAYGQGLSASVAIPKLEQELLTRRYPVDPNQVLQILARYSPADLSEAYTRWESEPALGQPAQQFGRGNSSIVYPPRAPALHRLWAELFRANRLVWQPAKQVLLNTNPGSLWIRAAAEDFHVLEPLLASSGTPRPTQPPGVQVQVHFVEIDVNPATEPIRTRLGCDVRKSTVVDAWSKPIRGELSSLGLQERVRRSVIGTNPPTPVFAKRLSHDEYSEALEMLSHLKGVSLITPAVLPLVSGKEDEVTLTERSTTRTLGIKPPPDSQVALDGEGFEVGSTLALVEHVIDYPQPVGTIIEVAVQARTQKFLGAATRQNAKDVSPTPAPAQLFGLRQAYLKAAVGSGEALVIGLGTVPISSNEASPKADTPQPSQTLVAIVRPLLESAKSR